MLINTKLVFVPGCDDQLNDNVLVVTFVLVMSSGLLGATKTQNLNIINN